MQSVPTTKSIKLHVEATIIAKIPPKLKLVEIAGRDYNQAMKPDIPSDIITIIEQVYRRTKPISIFLYGSHARGDSRTQSDYELGVVFKPNKKWHRVDLNQLHHHPLIQFFPYTDQDLLEAHLDTPFPKTNFLRELTQGGAYTVAGQSLIENISPPPISAADVLEMAYFELGYVLASIHSSRAKDQPTAGNLFFKAALYTAKALVISQLHEYPLTYSATWQAIDRLKLPPPFIDLFKHAQQVRLNQPVEVLFSYALITCINQQLLPALQRRPLDTILVP